MPGSRCSLGRRGASLSRPFHRRLPCISRHGSARQQLLLPSCCHSPRGQGMLHALAPGSPSAACRSPATIEPWNSAQWEGPSNRLLELRRLGICRASCRDNSSSSCASAGRSGAVGGESGEGSSAASPASPPPATPVTPAPGTTRRTEPGPPLVVPTVTSTAGENTYDKEFGLGSGRSAAQQQQQQQHGQQGTAAGAPASPVAAPSITVTSNKNVEEPSSHGSPDDAGPGLGGQAAARWPAWVLLVAAVWGVAWPLTMGPVSTAYTCLAAAASLAAAAFGPLTATAAAAAPAAAAAVDWVDVALRTAAGLSGGGGGAGRDQVLAALQDAGAGPVLRGAVMAGLPALCRMGGACRAAAAALQTGAPWLGGLAQLCCMAAGGGVLLALGMPLRRFLAPLLPRKLLPRGRPQPATLAAVKAGGAACMVAVLTGLQLAEVAAPSLSPGGGGAAAAAIATIGGASQQHSPLLYAAIAMVSDVVLPVCTATVALHAVQALTRPGPGAGGSVTPSAREDKVGAATDGGDGRALPEAHAGAEGEAGIVERQRRAWRGVRWLAAGRLAVELVLLGAVASGRLRGRISAARLLGMLWLFQTARQL